MSEKAQPSATLKIEVVVCIIVMDRNSALLSKDLEVVTSEIVWQFS